MHTLLIVVSLLLALGGGLACSHLLRLRPARAWSWDSRRVLAVAGMLLPVAVLGLMALLMAHFLSWLCFWAAPPFDATLSLIFSFAGAAVLVAAFSINTARVALFLWRLRQRTWAAPAWLEGEVARCANELGVRRVPQVLVAVDERPWALVAGPLRPYLALSSGLVALLDREELRAALCHELAHLRRGDLLWSALAGVLYDLTWFLPATRHLYRLLLAEQELACDDQVLGERRRVALASALARVWQAQARPPAAPRGALLLLSRREGRLEARVRRLLARSGDSDYERQAPLGALLIAGGLLGLLVLAQLGAAALVMEKMGCSFLLPVVTHYMTH